MIDAQGGKRIGGAIGAPRPGPATSRLYAEVRRPAGYLDKAE